MTTDDLKKDVLRRLLTNKKPKELEFCQRSTKTYRDRK